jgi:2-polyprenyl-6-methoxyphenol hydroxylase-like FAD-dependent oxidoreductase
MAKNVESHDCDSISSVMRTAADIIDESGIYKLRWAVLSEEISKIKQENEALKRKDT